MRKFLFVDTETRGLPLNYDASFTDVGNWPRIIQLAWELCWENGETIKKRCDLVKPDNWRIPEKQFFLDKGCSDEVATEKSKFWTEHGFTQAESEAKGLPMPDLLTELAIVMNQADVFVCHNLSYDKPIIECEFFRYKIYPKRVAESHPIDLRPSDRKLVRECTKLLSMPICKILLGTRGDYKWPSLAEAYFFMFRKEVENAHDAGADVQACKEIYLWIQEYNFMQELI